jgi:hypothetical protein
MSIDANKTNDNANDNTKNSTTDFVPFYSNYGYTGNTNDNTVTTLSTVEKRLYILENEFKNKGQRLINKIKRQEETIKMQSKQIYQLEHDIRKIKDHFYMNDNSSSGFYTHSSSEDEESEYLGDIEETKEEIKKKEEIETKDDETKKDTEEKEEFSDDLGYEISDEIVKAWVD